MAGGPGGEDARAPALAPHYFSRFFARFIRNGSRTVTVYRNGRGFRARAWARVPRGDSSMSTFELTRRAALVALVALAGSPAVAARRALARAGPSGGIRVDVAPLLENSGQPTAGWVAQTLPAAISQALAATGRTGVSVAVTIDSVILGPNSGGVGPGHSPDQIVGTVTIAGVERPLRATSTY